MGRVEGNYGGFLFKNAVQAGLNTARRRARGGQRHDHHGAGFSPTTKLSPRALRRLFGF
jgi:hypothetical protein